MTASGRAARRDASTRTSALRTPILVSAPDIWIGDVIRAWDSIGATTPDERRRVAEVLGFVYTAPGPAPEPAPRLERSTVRTERAAEHRRQPHLGPVVATDFAAARRRGDPDPASPAPGQVALPVRLESPDVGGPHGSPKWALVTDTVPGDEPRHLQHQPPLDPLFTPGWTRATLGALCATGVPEGPIDVRRVVDAVCQRRPVAVLPRFTIWTLRRGIQLLVDESEGFSFYRRDVADLVATLESLAGRDRTETLRFDDVPSRGVRSGVLRPQHGWRAPAPGTPIVVLSDFGLSRGARTRLSASLLEWEQFSRLARAAGCALLGIVPIGPSRWPLRLRRAVRLLRWDRTATAGLARRIARGEIA